MTNDEHKRLWDLIQNPPPGSKIAAAKEYGVDLTLNLRLLGLNPTERAEELNDLLQFSQELETGHVTSQNE